MKHHKFVLMNMKNLPRFHKAATGCHIIHKHLNGMCLLNLTTSYRQSLQKKAYEYKFGYRPGLIERYFFLSVLVLWKERTQFLSQKKHMIILHQKYLSNVPWNTFYDDIVKSSQFGLIVGRNEVMTILECHDSRDHEASHLKNEL